MTDYGEHYAPGCIRFERWLDATVETVWDYLVDPAKRARWLAAGEFELRPGGRAEFVFRNGRLSEAGDEPPEKYRDGAGEVRFEGRVLEVTPLSRLVLEWPAETGPPAVVTIELEERDGRTRLTLTETGLGRASDLIGAAAGWHAHFAILKALLGNATPPSFWAHHTQLESDYEERLGSG